MKSSINPQGTVAAEKTASDQLELHLSELPKSRQTAHTMLGVLLLLVMVITVGLMAWSIYVSIRANYFGQEYVPFWWFIWATSVSLFLAIFGFSTVVAQASPPFIIGRGEESLVFGRQAERKGLPMAALGLLGTVAFAALAIYVGVTGVNWLDQFITGVVIFWVGLGLISALIAIVSKIMERLR